MWVVASLKGNGRERPVTWTAIRLPADASLLEKGWAMRHRNGLLQSCEESGKGIREGVTTVCERTQLKLRPRR